MKISERSLSDVTVLDMEGRITADSPVRVLGATVRALLQKGHKRILVNMEQVPFIDSTGLADIVEAYTTTRRQGGDFKLENLTPHVRELLRITMLSTVLQVFDSEADALASFGAAAS